MKKKILLIISLFFIIFLYPNAESIINYDWSFDKTNYNYGLGLNNVLVNDNNYFTWHIDSSSFINVINKYDESGKLLNSYEPDIETHIVDLIFYDNTFITIDKLGNIYKLDNNFKVLKKIKTFEKVPIINDKSELKISNNTIYYIDKINLNIYSTDYNLDNYNLINIKDLSSIEELITIAPFLSSTDQMYFKYLFAINTNDKETTITDVLKVDDNYYITSYSALDSSSSIRLVDESLNVLWLDNLFNSIPLKVTVYNDYIFILTYDDNTDYFIKSYNKEHKYISSEKINLSNKLITPISIKTIDNSLIVKSLYPNKSDNLNLTLGENYDEIIIDKYNFNIYDIRTIVKGEGTINVIDSGIKGAIIPFDIIPANGYILDKLSIKDSEGNSIFIEDFTFKMPASDVTITATFVADNPKTSDNIHIILPILFISLDILIFTIYQYKRCKN